MIKVWESMEDTVLEESAGHGKDGQDGEQHLRQGQAGAQCDGQGGDHHLRVRPGGMKRVSRSSREFEDLRAKV